jgi:hypothetical protein
MSARLLLAVLDRLQRGGEAFVSNAVISGRYVLRACIVNVHTSHDDVVAAVDIAARVGREVHAEGAAGLNAPAG